MRRNGHVHHLRVGGPDSELAEGRIFFLPLSKAIRCLRLATLSHRVVSDVFLTSQLLAFFVYGRRKKTSTKSSYERSWKNSAPSRLHETRSEKRCDGVDLR